MSRLKLWIGIVLVFVLGTLAGSLGMGAYIKHRFEHFVFEDSASGHPHRPPGMHFLMKKLSKELDLSDTQRHDIELIMNETFEKVHSFMQEQHPELEKMVEENLERIKEKLDPEQKEKLQRMKLFEVMKERFHQRHSLRRGFEGETPDRVFTALRERLKLSEAQEKELRPIIIEDIEKRKKLMEAYHSWQRTYRNMMREGTDELSENTAKQLEKILTQEQMDLYREIQAEQRMHMSGSVGNPGPHGFD